MDRGAGATMGQNAYWSSAVPQVPSINSSVPTSVSNGVTRATAILSHNMAEMSLRHANVNSIAGIHSQPNLSALQFSNHTHVNGNRANGESHRAHYAISRQHDIAVPTFTFQQASSRPVIKPQPCLAVKPSTINDGAHYQQQYAAYRTDCAANGTPSQNYQRTAVPAVATTAAFQSQPHLNVCSDGQKQPNAAVRHHAADRNYLNYNAAGDSGPNARPQLVPSLSSGLALREAHQPVKCAYNNNPSSTTNPSVSVQQQQPQARYYRPQIFTAHACPTTVIPNYARTPALSAAQSAQRMSASTGNLASLTLSSTVYSDDGDSETYFAAAANTTSGETDVDDRDSDASNTKNYYASTWNISAIDSTPVASTAAGAQSTGYAPADNHSYQPDVNPQYQTPLGGNMLLKPATQPPPPPYSQSPSTNYQHQHIYANAPPVPAHADQYYYASTNGINSQHNVMPVAANSPSFMDADDVIDGSQYQKQQNYSKYSIPALPSKLSHVKSHAAAADASQQQQLPPAPRAPETIRYFSSDAFKFYMEQHIENVMKSYQERMLRARKLEQELYKSCLTTYEKDRMRQLLNEKESKYLRLKRAKMNMSHFVKLKTVGIGAFGEVALVRKIDTGQLYAMKTLRKKDVFKRNQVAHVKAERDILAEADNEWVVKLYYSFQDRECLYFVMDYVPGGDLMNLLINRGIFDEPMARFYTAQLVCAIESVHRMGFIHRDIKPDNILIDAKGHIKLTDFGLCTGFRWTHSSKYYRRTDDTSSSNSNNNVCDADQCDTLYGKCVEVSPGVMQKPLDRRKHRFRERRMAHSLVGTPNYIAPEVLQRQGYTRLCDWWSVGVILYEMIIGQPPFYDKDQATTQYKVINWRKYLRIPDHAVHTVSREAQDLILRLCSDVPMRLGARGPEEIKSHPFFTGIKWDDGSLRRHKGPFVPELKAATDTSHFDSFGDDSRHHDDDDDEMDDVDMTAVDNNASSKMKAGKNSVTAAGSGDAADPQHAFYEFTFRRFFEDGQQSVPLPPTFCNNLVGNFGSSGNNN